MQDMITDDNDKDLERLFKECRNEIPDNGFTENLKDRLPQRPSFLPQIVMCICILVGMAFVFMIHSFETIVDNTYKFVLAVSQLQCPPIDLTLTCLGVLFCVCTIAYAMVTTE
jgi:hypothetical protein